MPLSQRQVDALMSPFAERQLDRFGAAKVVRQALSFYCRFLEPRKGVQFAAKPIVAKKSVRATLQYRAAGKKRRIFNRLRP